MIVYFNNFLGVATVSSISIIVQREPLAYQKYNNSKYYYILSDTD